MLFSVLLACAATPPPTPLEQSPDPAAAVAERLERDAPEGVLASIAVIHGQEVQLLGEPERLYELGSISKVFNAWLLATLEQEGVLSEEDLLSEHYPVVPQGDGAQIRLKHLASHSSGLSRLPGDMSTMYLLRNAANPYVDYNAEMLQAAVADAKVKDPGSTWAYSNFAAGLLGQVMSDKVGEPWAQALDARVLAPHGLSGIGELDPPAGFNAFGEVQPWDFDALASAGSLDGDLNTMVAFSQLWLEPDPSMASMLSLRFEGEPMNNGLGWIQGEGFWWHNGGTAAYSTFVAVDPERDVAVVILLNQSSPAVTELGMALMALERGQ